MGGTTSTVSRPVWGNSSPKKATSWPSARTAMSSACIMPVWGSSMVNTTRWSAAERPRLDPLLVERTVDDPLVLEGTRGGLRKS